MLYSWLTPVIEKHILVDQAKLRPGRSCTEQAVSLTRFIENGFTENLKRLSSSSIYHQRMIQAGGMNRTFLQLFSYRTFSALLKKMLANRLFIVRLADKESKQRRLIGGIPQGSVLLALILWFVANKFIFASACKLKQMLPEARRWDGWRF